MVVCARDYPGNYRGYVHNKIDTRRPSLITGLVTLLGAAKPDGQPFATQDLIDLRLVKPNLARQPRGWGLAREEVPLGYNLFTDNGRQYLAYMFGGRNPLSSFFCQRFSVGTGTSAAARTDVALQNPVYLDPPTNSTTTKLISSVSYSVPFVARIEFALAASEANGYLLTELGLFSGNNTLLARKTNLGIQKSSDFSPLLGWRIRF